MIKASTQLKYRRIMDEMDDFISTCQVGEKLPSDRELARRFDCNALTVRKALATFVESGRIERKVGSGTFITDTSKEPHAADTATPSRDPNTIGMLIHARSDSYALKVIESIHAAMAERKLKLRFFYITEFKSEAPIAVRQLQQEKCSAIILPWFPAGANGEVADFVRCSPIPVVLPALIYGLEKHCFEKPDLYGSGTRCETEAACTFFLQSAKKKIALLGSNVMEDSIMQRRLTVYSNFVFREELPNICGLVGDSVAEMDDLAAKWKQYSGDLAIFCHDDLHAARFMTAARKVGMSAPKDFVIIGCNNSRESQYTDPPLTTIDLDFSYFGKQMIDSARALAKGEVHQADFGARHHLVLRESTASCLPLTQQLIENLSEQGMDIIEESTPINAVVAT